MTGGGCVEGSVESRYPESMGKIPRISWSCLSWAPLLWACYHFSCHHHLLNIRALQFLLKQQHKTGHGTVSKPIVHPPTSVAHSCCHSSSPRPLSYASVNPTYFPRPYSNSIASLKGPYFPQSWITPPLNCLSVVPLQYRPFLSISNSTAEAIWLVQYFAHHGQILVKWMNGYPNVMCVLDNEAIQQSFFN